MTISQLQNQGEFFEQQKSWLPCRSKWFVMVRCFLALVCSTGYGIDADQAAGTNNPATNEGLGLINLDFHQAPLESVLNYMSSAAGFVIMPEAEIKGTVDIISTHAVTKDVAVELLNTVLQKKGLTAIRRGNTLLLVTIEEAKRRNLPTVLGGDPAEIPKDDLMVTQVIPVRSVSAVQAVKELGPLLPTTTQLSADEAGNALIMTDTRTNIRRVAEIIKALDTIGSTENLIRVFPLRYGDAKSMSGVLKDVFPGQDNSKSSNGSGGGGFGGPMFGGPGAGSGGGGDAGSGSQPRAYKVQAVADDHSNSLIVSAPEGIMELVSKVVKSLDTPMTGLTDIRVFHMVNADPTETVDLLTSLFPDDSNQNTANGGGGGPVFGPGPPGMGMMFGNTANSGTGTRARDSGKVVAVPDRRTSSLVVTAARSLMPQVVKVVRRLDADSSRKQSLHVQTLHHAQTEDVQLVLSDLFQSQSGNTRAARGNSSQSGSVLATRSQTLLQQTIQNSSTSSTGNGTRTGQ